MPIDNDLPYKTMIEVILAIYILVGKEEKEIEKSNPDASQKKTQLKTKLNSFQNKFNSLHSNNFLLLEQLEKVKKLIGSKPETPEILGGDNNLKSLLKMADEKLQQLQKTQESAYLDNLYFIRNLLETINHHQLKNITKPIELTRLPVHDPRYDSNCGGLDIEQLNPILDEQDETIEGSFYNLVKFQGTIDTILSLMKVFSERNKKRLEKASNQGEISSDQKQTNNGSVSISADNADDINQGNKNDLTKKISPESNRVSNFDNLNNSKQPAKERSINDYKQPYEPNEINDEGVDNGESTLNQNQLSLVQGPVSFSALVRELKVDAENQEGGGEETFNEMEDEEIEIEQPKSVLTNIEKAKLKQKKAEENFNKSKQEAEQAPEEDKRNNENKVLNEEEKIKNKAEIQTQYQNKIAQAEEKYKNEAKAVAKLAEKACETFPKDLTQNQAQNQAAKVAQEAIKLIGQSAQFALKIVQENSSQTQENIKNSLNEKIAKLKSQVDEVNTIETEAKKFDSDSQSDEVKKRIEICKENANQAQKKLSKASGKVQEAISKGESSLTSTKEGESAVTTQKICLEEKINTINKALSDLEEIENTADSKKISDQFLIAQKAHKSIFNGGMGITIFHELTKEVTKKLNTFIKSQAESENDIRSASEEIGSLLENSQLAIVEIKNIQTTIKIENVFNIVLAERPNQLNIEPKQDQKSPEEMQLAEAEKLLADARVKQGEIDVSLVKKIKAQSILQTNDIQSLFDADLNLAGKNLLSSSPKTGAEDLLEYVEQSNKDNLASLIKVEPRLKDLNISNSEQKKPNELAAEVRNYAVMSALIGVAENQLKGVRQKLDEDAGKTRAEPGLTSEALKKSGLTGKSSPSNKADDERSASSGSDSSDSSDSSDDNDSDSEESKAEPAQSEISQEIENATKLLKSAIDVYNLRETSLAEVGGEAEDQILKKLQENVLQAQKLVAEAEEAYKIIETNEQEIEQNDNKIGDIGKKLEEKLKSQFAEYNKKVKDYGYLTRAKLKNQPSYNTIEACILLSLNVNNTNNISATDADKLIAQALLNISGQQNPEISRLVCLQVLSEAANQERFKYKAELEKNKSEALNALKNAKGLLPDNDSLLSDYQNLTTPEGLRSDVVQSKQRLLEISNENLENVEINLQSIKACAASVQNTTQIINDELIYTKNTSALADVALKYQASITEPEQDKTLATLRERAEQAADLSAQANEVFADTIVKFQEFKQSFDQGKSQIGAIQTEIVSALVALNPNAEDGKLPDEVKYGGLRSNVKDALKKCFSLESFNEAELKLYLQQRCKSELPLVPAPAEDETTSTSLPAQVEDKISQHYKLFHAASLSVLNELIKERSVKREGAKKYELDNALIHLNEAEAEAKKAADAADNTQKISTTAENNQQNNNFSEENKQFLLSESQRELTSAQNALAAVQNSYAQVEPLALKNTLASQKEIDKIQKFYEIINETARYELNDEELLDNARTLVAQAKGFADEARGKSDGVNDEYNRQKVGSTPAAIAENKTNLYYNALDEILELVGTKETKDKERELNESLKALISGFELTQESPEFKIVLKLAAEKISDKASEAHLQALDFLRIMEGGDNEPEDPTLRIVKDSASDTSELNEDIERKNELAAAFKLLSLQQQLDRIQQLRDDALQYNIVAGHIGTIFNHLPKLVTTPNTSPFPVSAELVVDNLNITRDLAYADGALATKQVGRLSDSLKSAIENNFRGELLGRGTNPDEGYVNRLMAEKVSIVAHNVIAEAFDNPFPAGVELNFKDRKRELFNDFVKIMKIMLEEKIDIKDGVDGENSKKNLNFRSLQGEIKKGIKEGKFSAFYRGPNAEPNLSNAIEDWEKISAQIQRAAFRKFDTIEGKAYSADGRGAASWRVIQMLDGGDLNKVSDDYTASRVASRS